MCILHGLDNELNQRSVSQIRFRFLDDGVPEKSAPHYARAVVRKFFWTKQTKSRTLATDMVERLKIRVTVCQLTTTALMVLTACDPVHDLRLENGTNKNIEVIYSPTLDQQELEGHEPLKIITRGREMNSITLEPTQTIRIGRVTARYNPKATDINLDYLEIRFDNDTLKLTGQQAILSTIQKVEKLDWRLIIRSE